MIDKNDPEIQKYVEEELQKQKEQIAERMIWRYIDVPYFGPTYREIEYYIGLSLEIIDKIADKCRWKRNYRDGYKEGALLTDVRYVRHMLKNQEQDAALEYMEDSLADPSGLKAWRKNPNKYAVLEVVSHDVETEDIMKALQFTEDELQALYPTDEELDTYHPIFKEEGPSEKEMEEAYQKMQYKIISLNGAAALMRQPPKFQMR